MVYLALTYVLHFVLVFTKLLETEPKSSLRGYGTGYKALVGLHSDAYGWECGSRNLGTIRTLPEFYLYCAI